MLKSANLAIEELEGESGVKRSSIPPRCDKGSQDVQVKRRGTFKPRLSLLAPPIIVEPVSDWEEKGEERGGGTTPSTTETSGPPPASGAMVGSELGVEMISDAESTHNDLCPPQDKEKQDVHHVVNPECPPAGLRGRMEPAVSNGRVSESLLNLLTLSLNFETLRNVGIPSPVVQATCAALEGGTTAESAMSPSQSEESPLPRPSQSEELRSSQSEELRPSQSEEPLPSQSEASPLPRPSQSEEQFEFSSDCEASEEYESEEEGGKSVYIDADSLFCPVSNSLFTSDLPPELILPRLACAGDFPLEVDSSAISSMALDIVRQGIIHAPPRNDLSSEFVESDLTASEQSDNTIISSGAASGTLSAYPSAARGTPFNLSNDPSSIVQGQSSVPPPDTAVAVKASPKPRNYATKKSRARRSSKSGSTKSPRPGSKSTEETPLPRDEQKEGSKEVGVIGGGATVKRVKGVAQRKLAKVTKVKGTMKTAEVPKVKKGGVAKERTHGKKEKGNAKLHLQLVEHMARLEELKGHLASKSTQQVSTSGVVCTQTATSMDSENDPSCTCARTSGYVYVRKSSRDPQPTATQAKEDNKQPADSASTQPTGSAKKRGKWSLESILKEIADVIEGGKRSSEVGPRSSVDNQAMSDKLSRLWLSSQQSLLDTVPHPLPVMTDCNLSTIPEYRLTQSLTRMKVKEKVIDGVDKLSNSPTTQHSSVALRHTTFRPYSSPLLMFQSYRLNPLYRTNERLTLQSLSHSNRIDPNKIMCRFELGGICNNASCGGQHLKDIGLNKEGLIEDLVCYAPQLAGCEGNSPLLEREKIASYASQMVERYSNKVSDEDLFKLTVHNVNKERAKTIADQKGKSNYVSFEERVELSGGDSGLVTVHHPISLLAVERSSDQTRQRGEVDSEAKRGMEWQSITKELAPFWRYQQKERCVV